MKRNKGSPLGLPVEKMRGKSVKEWLKKKTRAKAAGLVNPWRIFKTVFFLPFFGRIHVFCLCMQVFVDLLLIPEYLPEAPVQSFAVKLKVLRFASDHSQVQEYFKTNYGCKIKIKKLDTYFKFRPFKTFGACKIRLLW